MLDYCLSQRYNQYLFKVVTLKTVCCLPLNEWVTVRLGRHGGDGFIQLEDQVREGHTQNCVN